MRFASYCSRATSMKTLTVRLTTMDQPMRQKAGGSKTQEKLIGRIRRSGVGGKSLSNTVDGPFVKSLKMRMGTWAISATWAVLLKHRAHVFKKSLLTRVNCDVESGVPEGFRASQIKLLQHTYLFWIFVFKFATCTNMLTFITYRSIYLQTCWFL